MRGPPPPPELPVPEGCKKHEDKCTPAGLKAKDTCGAGDAESDADTPEGDFNPQCCCVAVAGMAGEFVGANGARVAAIPNHERDREGTY